MHGLSHLNTLAFILENGIINENQVPLEMYNHRSLIKFYMDESEQIAAVKCAQIGGSTTKILKAIHLCRYRDANVIYTLPSRSVVKDFVSPKVDPLIASNPAIEAMIGKTDSTALKQIGNRFLYFRGSWEPDSAISISAHALINDEVDRSNPKTLKTFKTRLDAARMERPDLGFVWQFSNPSIPGNGVDEPYQESDKKHWFIKCHTCNYEWYMMYPDNIDFVRKIYICTKCRNELTDEDRRRGRWVQKHTGRDISGYWFNQMMMPWIPAKKIIADSKGDPQIFHNFTLGMPFINKNQQLTRSALVRCISPDENPQIGNAIGVDVGVVKHYVIGNRYGIFKVGRTESWEEIESLRNRYAAVMVIDALPFPHEPRRMVASYPGKVFMHYFSKDKQRTEIIHWGEHEKDGIVESDRTKIIDAVTADIMAEDIIFNMTHAEMELFINHCLALYRTTRETRQGSREGVVVPVWETIDNKDDHYFFALTYFKIALEKATISSAIINTRPIVEKLSSPVGDLHGTPHIQDDIMADIKSMQQKAGHDWR